MSLSVFTLLPLHAHQPLPLMQKAGVYVVVYYTTQIRYTDGHTAQTRLHGCLHFDARKRIDQYIFYQ